MLAPVAELGYRFKRMEQDDNYLSWPKLTISSTSFPGVKTSLDTCWSEIDRTGGRPGNILRPETVGCRNRPLIPGAMSRPPGSTRPPKERVWSSAVPAEHNVRYAYRR